MPFRYRTDAYTLHVQVVRSLVPGIKVSGLTCQQCSTRRQMLFVHPDNPDLWLCHTCMHFDRSSHGSYQLSAIARAQSALEHAATAFLDPQPHTKRERDHDDAAHPERGTQEDIPRTEGSRGDILIARTVDTPPPTPPGSTDTPPVSPRTASTTPPPTSTPRLRTPIAPKGTKSRSRPRKSL